MCHYLRHRWEDLSSRLGWATYGRPSSNEVKDGGKEEGEGSMFLRAGGEIGRRRCQRVGHCSYLGVALKGTHMVSSDRAIFLAITESPFQAHLDRVSGILVSTI